MFNAYEDKEKYIVSILGFCFILAFSFLIYHLSTKTPYHKMIDSCKSIGFFYINENLSIECKVLKK